MKPSLQLKLSQHLALTPQLQQSIRLLQLSTLELNQELEQILSDNPLIERLDDPMASALRITANGALQSTHSGPAPDPGEADRSGPSADGADGGFDGDFDTGGRGSTTTFVEFQIAMLSGS